MFNIMKRGFTLSETLITLGIIGTVAVLVLPGIIKDSTNKAMLSALQSTVTSINDAIQNELISKDARTIDDTTISSNPKNFFENNFETTKSVSNNTLFTTSYKTFDGATTVVRPNMTTSVILKNGVTIGYRRDASDGSTTDSIYIDTNGESLPNVIGIDMFIIEMSKVSDETNQVGDFVCDFNNDTDLVEECKTEGSTYCYCALSESGFDTDYLK